MLDKLRNDKLISGWNTSAMIIFLLLMLAGLFFSRVLLSTSMIGFILVCFLHADPGSHFRKFISTPLLWGMSLLFFIPLVTGAWSEDKLQWSEILWIKLPLFFMPLAFAGPVHLTKKQWQFIAYFFIALLMGSAIWTMNLYLSNAPGINASYLRAKTMNTPLDNDHVRYSWLISTGMLVSAALAILNWKDRKWFSIIWILVAICFLVFLHILAARTGLLAAYLIILLTASWLLYKKANWKTAVILLLLLASLPFLAYQALPSFRNKLKFFLYEKGFFEKTNYLPGSTDAVRIISIKAGWKLMNENPLLGKGFGDVQAETNKWYENNYPGMKESDKILPSSEWMIYGSGSGWTGLFLFILAMVTPFFTSSKNKVALWLISISASSSLLFDIGLEVQYGVFLYAFVLLCGWKWLNAENI